MQRFFVPPEILDGQEEVLLPAEIAHHLGTVLRRPVGEEILLLDGSGTICRSRVTAIGRRSGAAQVLARWREEETALPITLLQVLPKGDKMELILQKGTELGISGFVPVLAGRNVPTPDAGRGEGRRQRWQRIIQEAARQSRRPLLPHLCAPLPLAASLAECREELRLLLWEGECQPIAAMLPCAPPRSAALLVGPEGGFAPEEVETARAAGFQPVRFGPRILRSETAGFAVASILQYLYGDLGERSARPPGKSAPKEQP